MALAMVRPADEWYQATSPLLLTVEIMQFIRKEYGKNYKPNSRETIRRHTLHQFEQARIIDRNRDDPKRPTNSKDNNYSLNQPILDILANYPDGDWKEKLRKFKYVVPELKDQYLRRLDLNKIPITLPDGEKVKLSPGNHNQLQADIVHEFCSRFIGEDGRLLYIGDTASSNEAGGKLMYLDQAYFQNLGIPPLLHDKFRCPDLVYFLSANVMTASSRISSIFRQPVSHVKQDRQSRNCHGKLAGISNVNICKNLGNHS